MNLKKIIVSIILVCSFMGSVIVLASSGPPSNVVIDELWGLPILAHGGSLNEDQLAQTKAVLGVSDREVELIPVTGEDVVYFLGMGNPSVPLYSSALITRTVEGSGVIVSILTPHNIQRITETQYANAMITAGVTDALVEVASVVPVTGEAALTGIYKAFAERGIELDSERIEVAQEELQLTSSIANAHQDNEDFDAENLDHALIEIKSELADFYEQTGELASAAEIAEFIQEALENNNLDDILTADQISRLNNFAGRFQATDAINSPELRDQLDTLANYLEGGLQMIRDAANDPGFWEGVRNFFQGIADFFTNLFS